MRILKLAVPAYIVLLLCSSVFPQTPTGDAYAEKIKKSKEAAERVTQMLDQTIGEAASLRLPENRAVVFALAGDLYWKFDTKRSRELFRNAAAELAAFNGEAEREKQDNEFAGFAEQADPRRDILQMIASRDPELALELMPLTRSAALAEAMAKASQLAAAPDTPTPMTREISLGRAELQLEQQFAMRAAALDPEKTVKLIKEMLSKGISYNLISLLGQLNQKDEKKAAELAGDVVSKIVETDLAKSSSDLNGSVIILAFTTRPAPAPAPNVKIFSFSEAQARDIANKLASTFLQNAATTSLMNAMTRAMPSIEKLVPEKAALLKQRQAQYKKSTPAAARPARAARRTWDPASSPEELIAAAGRMPNARDRVQVYQAAAAKIAAIADEERARKLADQIQDERTKRSTIERLDVARITRLGAAGNLEDARRLISALPGKKARIQRLVNLALQYRRKVVSNDNETAGALMAEAKAQTNPFPNDEDELADLMEVVRGYAEIEPDTAFRMMEPIIDELNAVVQATAVLSKYNKRDRSFRNGEMVMRVSGPSSGLLALRYSPQIVTLGRADLERASTLVDRFQRSDARLLMRLYVLQGYIKLPPLIPPAAGK